MTISQLISRLTEIEWEDFEVKEARSDIPKNASSKSDYCQIFPGSETG
jgi:hypothetical protein